MKTCLTWFWETAAFNPTKEERQKNSRVKQSERDSKRGKEKTEACG